jgi:hypothetical protein
MAPSAVEWLPMRDGSCRVTVPKPLDATLGLASIVANGTSAKVAPL